MEDFEVYEEHNEEDVKQNSFNEKSENTEMNMDDAAAGHLCRRKKAIVYEASQKCLHHQRMSADFHRRRFWRSNTGISAEQIEWKRNRALSGS